MTHHSSLHRVAKFVGPKPGAVAGASLTLGAQQLLSRGTEVGARGS